MTTTMSSRQRILDAALQLTSAGGYDALQVRALAEHAQVSSRTIYANFPSLDALLIVSVAEQSGALFRGVADAAPRGRTASARVQRLVADLTETMTANRPVIVALLRALFCGKQDVVPYLRGFSARMNGVLARAIAPDGATASDHEVAEILQGLWFGLLIAWASDITDEEHIRTVMRTAARRLLNDA